MAFRIDLPLDISAIETGRLALLDYLAPFAVGDRALGRIEVILEELVSNVVRHGSAVASLAISAVCDGGDVCLTIEDDGAAFDPLAAPLPAPFSTLSDATPGGLGISLVRKLAREVRYERIGKGDGARNRVMTIVAAH